MSEQSLNPVITEDVKSVLSDLDLKPDWNEGPEESKWQHTLMERSKWQNQGSSSMNLINAAAASSHSRSYQRPEPLDDGGICGICECSEPSQSQNNDGLWWICCVEGCGDADTGSNSWTGNNDYMETDFYSGNDDGDTGFDFDCGSVDCGGAED